MSTPIPVANEHASALLNVGGVNLTSSAVDDGSVTKDWQLIDSWVSSDTVTSLADLLLSEPDFRMSEQLHRYLTPVLIIIGNFSNLLALLVLRRKNLRQHSACFYMSAYAIANLLVLNLVSGVAWLCYILQKPYIATLSDWGCGLWTFMANVMIYSGIWFVVAMTIDRYVLLCYPNKALTMCTVFTAKVSSVFIMIGLVVISVHAMWTYQLQEHGCFIPYHMKDLHILIWPWMSATFYSYLPLLLLFHLNICLMVSLCLKRHRLRPTIQADGGDDFIVITLIISMSFFALAVPATIINLIDIHAPSSWLNAKLIAQIELTKKVTGILSAANQAVLGYLLLICSKTFRTEFARFFTDLTIKRRPKVYEMRNMSGNDDSSRIHVEYEICSDGTRAITTTL
ncbi:probable G-protein coupled receptor 139 [Haliotis rubra]|uniref:probable G-protein coupled receptor 139 n=1 Tax=Haliotis rubra TaxID=36100 RepID=UPI001EE5D8A7|nr:probable G-protein coupled receptor 139 [Haliotis rubra]